MGIFNRIRSLQIPCGSVGRGWILLLWGLTATHACSTPGTPLSGATTDELLAGAVTRPELVARIGGAPYRCVLAEPGKELCAWAVDSRYAIWPDLAAAAGTEQAINVICRLWADDAPREPESCKAIPRSSNTALRTRDGETEGAGKRSNDEPSLLAAAGTLSELAFLIGDLPWDCSFVDGRTRSCVWKATSQTYGHALIASMVPTRAKVRLHCVVPKDGSPREPDSCWAEKGA